MTPRPANLTSPTRLTQAIAVVGVLLHAYVALFKADGGFSLFLVGLLLMSWLPYAIAAGIAYVESRAVFGLGFALASLAGDLYMHYSVFIAPKGSTAALGLLFMPMWNLIILGPLGGFLFWLAKRLMSRR
jgi:hypothetical protein